MASPSPPPSLSQEVIQVTPVKLPEGWSKPKAFYEANKIDFHLCSIMFWFMGGRVSKAMYHTFHKRNIVVIS